MRGRGNSYPPHGRHINDAFPGLWPLRFRRSQLKLRRQQFWCCQLFFNCPFYGGQAPPPAYPASTPPSKPVRPRIFALEKPEVFREWVAVCHLPATNSARLFVLQSYIFSRVPENLPARRQNTVFYRP